MKTREEAEGDGRENRRGMQGRAEEGRRKVNNWEESRQGRKQREMEGKIGEKYKGGQKGEGRIIMGREVKTREEGGGDARESKSAKRDRNMDKERRKIRRGVRRRRDIR